VEDHPPGPIFLLLLLLLLLISPFLHDRFRAAYQ
jgi:hypothetical protein